MARLFLFAFALLAAAPAGATPPRQATEAISAARARALHDADARRLADGISGAAHSAEASLRHQAIRAAARFRSPAASELLSAAVLDEDPGVRAEAARGLAQQAALPRSEREALLLGALSRELEPPVRGSILEALAHVSSPPTQEILAAALDAPDASEQTGACRAFGVLFGRGRAPLPGTPLHILQLTSKDAPSRLPCLHALAALRHRPQGGPSAPVASRLVAIAKAPDPVAARAALRALQHFGRAADAAAVRLLVHSPSIRVAAAAARTLAALQRPAALIHALHQERAAFQRASPTPAGKRVQILSLLYALVQDHADHPLLSEPGARAIAAWAPDTGDNARIAAARALLDCSAAELADRVRGWPQRTFACGHGLLPPDFRASASARVLARDTDSHGARAALLRRLLEDELEHSTPAVYRAVATLPPAQATPLLLDGLGRAGTAHVPAALAALGLAGAAYREDPRIQGSLLQLEAAVTADPRLAAPWLSALRTLGLRRASDAIARLAAASPQGVWELARRLRSDWGLSAPAGPAPPANPIAADSIPAAGAGFHVQLRTPGGLAELALDTSAAPVAVARLLQQVRAGALKGAPVAEHVPGIYLSIRLPPAPLLRHEDSSLRIERGTVLLRDLGRDAVTPTLWIALGREPALDGHVTIIGSVRSGLEHLEGLHVLDRIEDGQQTESAPPL